MDRRAPRSTSLQSGEPPDATVRVAKQYKKVTSQEMLMWEHEGGHTLQRHNCHLTRGKLLERVIGEKVLSVPPQGKGPSPTDFRVWGGHKSPAASRWCDQATMHSAISEVIHQNLDQIRTATAGGREVVLEKVPLGFKSGSGWVKTKGATPAETGVFWDDSLRGATVVIRPRPFHAPSKSDPETWYVHTAHPDRAK